jgi:hypothetical protein
MLPLWRNLDLEHDSMSKRSGSRMEKVKLHVRSDFGPICELYILA